MVENAISASSATPMSASGPGKHYHCLFGLVIRSDVPLPCPLSECTNSDINLAEATEYQIASCFTGEPTTADEDGFWQCRTYIDGTVGVVCRGHFEFAISSDGRRVLWRKFVPLSNEVLFTYLLGQVLSYCLLSRGREQLHATAVVIDGGAISLLGGCGYGKSTLAAALLSRGYSLLTDDLLVLEFTDSAVFALPSVPRIKLTPESSASLLAGRDAIPMNLLTSKEIFALEPGQHAVSKVPLRSVYVLPKTTTAARISIRRLQGRASFLPLIRNTFNDSVRTPQRLQQQFSFAMQLARSVPINRLAYPKRMELLPSVVDAIADDVRGILP